MKKILMLNNVFINKKLIRQGEIVELSDADLKKLSENSQYIIQSQKNVEVKSVKIAEEKKEVKEVK